jgi:hypothetical protein
MMSQVAGARIPGNAARYLSRAGDGSIWVATGTGPNAVHLTSMCSVLGSYSASASAGFGIDVDARAGGTGNVWLLSGNTNGGPLLALNSDATIAVSPFSIATVAGSPGRGLAVNPINGHVWAIFGTNTTASGIGVYDQSGHEIKSFHLGYGAGQDVAIDPNSGVVWATFGNVSNPLMLVKFADP